MHLQLAGQKWTTHLIVGSLVLAGCCRAAGRGDDSSAASIPIEPFVWIAFLKPWVGGRPAHSETLYVGRSGRIQRSAESNDGRLATLEEGRTSSEVLFRLVQDIPDSAPTSKPRAPGGVVVTDAGSGRIVVSFADDGGTYRMQSYPSDSLPDSVREVAERARARPAAETLSPAASGRYARAQRLPNFDPTVQTPDASLTAVEALKAPLLRDLLESEMALVPIGDSAPSPARAAGVALERGRPVHIRVDEVVYRIITFEIAP